MKKNIIEAWKADQGETEYEIVINREHVNRISFRKAMARIMSLHPGVPIQQSDVLDIKTDEHIRVSVHDHSNMAVIRNYCATNQLPQNDVKTIQKTTLSKEIYPADAHRLYTIKFSKEQNMSMLSYNLSSKQSKTFRVKRRYSIVPQNGILRFDFTIVKEGTGMKMSTCALREWYEIEVEALHNAFTQAMSNQALKDVMADAAEEVLKGLSNWPIFVLPIEITQAKLAWTQFLTKMNISPHVFPARKPYTLDTSNLPQIHAHAYLATEKVDGERFLMFATQNKVWMIDSKMVMRPTTATCQSQSGWIMDCECVRKLNRIIVLVFDVYYEEGKSVRDKPLAERLDIAATILKQIKVDASIQIDLKRFYKISEIDEIKGDSPDYKNDGLIFTPANLPVPIAGSWDAEFKWKPVELSTIDVKVKLHMDRTDLIVSGDKHAAKSAPHPPYVTFLKHLSTTAAAKPSKVHHYTDIVYATLDHVLTQTKEDQDDIRDGYIVEMYWDHRTWKPLRIRYDKTQPNVLTTVENVWNSITHPITLDMIKLPPNPNEESDVYYENAKDRKSNLMYEMQQFHNEIKTKLILSGSTKGPALFDVACGKGGDIMKWIHGGYRVVVGVDKSEDNIVNAKDGIYARLLKTRLSKDAIYRFLPMDSSIPYADQVEGISDPLLKETAQLVFKKTGFQTFDVVSCQFAIHYFFGSRASVDALFANINSVLKSGGTLIVTCLDADEVNRLLAKKTQLDGKEDGTLIWSIKKDYTTYDKSAFDQKIDVFLESIGKVHAEFLVPPSLLTKVADEHGFQLTSTSAPKKSKTKKDATAPSFEVGTGLFKEVPTSRTLNDTLKKYSYLNRWYIFQKR